MKAILDVAVCKLADGRKYARMSETSHSPVAGSETGYETFAQTQIRVLLCETIGCANVSHSTSFAQKESVSAKDLSDSDPGGHTSAGHFGPVWNISTDIHIHIHILILRI